MSVAERKAFYRRYFARCNAHDFAGLGEFVAAFPDYHWQLEHLLMDGDRLAAHFTDRGTHLGAFLGIAPTGRTVTALEFAVYHLVADKIGEVWVTADNLGTLRQLGALPDDGER